MAGYDDPRFLQLKFEAMEKDVAQLKKSTIPVLAYQRGPTPGWINAAQIGPGAGTRSAMHLHLDGNQSGVAPRQTVTDAAGTVRYEAGNLAALGVSGAQYGWRVSDANGVPIADAIGLSQVMSQLGSGDGTWIGSFSNTTTTPTLLPGLSITFSLVRTARVLTFLECTMFVSATASNGNVDLFLDGVDVIAGRADGASGFVQTNNLNIVTGTTFFSSNLAAGSHTIEARGYVESTPNTLTVQRGTITVYLLGT